jgi:ribosomal protein S18 acetylase RimI-like enzyme
VSPLDVVPVDRNDSVRVGAVLASAFHDAEQWIAVVPDPEVRRRKLEEMFAGTIKLTYAADGIAERTRGFEAVAIWLPPGRAIGAWAVVRSGFASARFVVTPPFPNLLRLMGMMRQFDQTHKQQMPDPHWYLMVLGVDPAYQQRGFGSMLVARGIERADSTGRPIYLEAESGPNVAFYESLGFEAHGEMTIKAYGLRFSLMIRHPA